MEDSATSILVVANPGGDADELTASIGAAGPWSVIVGDGGDDTLTQFAEIRPDVVVIGGTLDGGDGRALISAMRDSVGPRTFAIILVGDDAGPIKNALDALDFGVDRFVGRPLSTKALVYAVRTCAETVRTARLAASGAERLTDAVDQAVDDCVRDGMKALSFGLSPRTEDANDPVETIATEPSDGRETEGSAATTESGFAPVGDRGPDAIEARGGQASYPARSTTLVMEANGATPPRPSGAVRQAPAAVAAVKGPIDVGGDLDALWDLPSSADWREPTLIINSATGAGGADRPAELAGQPRFSSGDLDDKFDDSFDADLDDVEDLGSVLFDEERRRPSGTLAAEARDTHSDHSVVPSAPLPTEAIGGIAQDAEGSGFAHELRRRMSAMAERLSAGRRGDTPAIDVGLPHDHHTEIDLASIGGDTIVGVSRADFDAFEDAVTFAGGSEEAGEGSDSSLDTSPSYHEDDITEHGAIQHSSADTPILIARMHKARFSGRLAFRDGETEKTILFEEGRPVFATSNAEHDRMGDLLAREGKISHGQYAACRSAAVESGRRIGEVLVEVGYLKRRELLPAVRRHVEDIIYSLFAWDHGEYRVVGGGAAAKERIRLTRHPAAVVVEGIRRKFTQAVLTELVGPPDTVVEIADRDILSAMAAAADLSAGEREVLFSVDGVRTVEECSAVGGIGHDLSIGLIWSAVVLGALSLKRRSQDTQVDFDEEPPSLLVGETDLAIDRLRVMAKLALVNEADYFALLGVRHDASAFEIKRAYEAARKDFAPEAFPATVKHELEREIEEINTVIDEAYQVLRDEQIRWSYLSNLCE